jgi:cytochrome c-type biogenesis protein CcmH
MMWFLLALLAASALAPVILPLRRTETRAARNVERLWIYRDQLAQLPDDINRGVIEAGQGPAARLEIERRMLAAALAEETAEHAKPRAARPMRGGTAVTLATALVGGAFALYLSLGSPLLGEANRGTPLAAGSDAAERPADAPVRVQRPDLVASVASLTQKLASGAGDVDEWRRLARTQAELGRWQDSAESYRRLAALTGGAIEDAAGYGEVLVLAAKGVVTPAARTVFNGALVRDPSNMSARYYLGLADAQAGNPAAAIERWRQLEADAPKNSRWLTTLRRQIVTAAAMAGIDVHPATPSLPRSSSGMASSGSPSASPAPPAGPPGDASTAASGIASGAAGPTAADVEAAQALPQDQRLAIIRSMVDRLASRLVTTPDDFDGWQRLARSYRVLGEKRQAAVAAEHAAALRPSSETLLEAARAVFAVEGAEDPRVKLPPSFVTLLQRVLSLDPDEPDALWYLGLAQAQENDPKGASEYWRRLAASLPEDSERRKTVNAALAAIE